MDQPKASEQFVQHLTQNQNRIYGYVFSLVGNHNRAADIVQEVNLVLWRKLSEYDASKPFLPWALAVARFQVLAHIRDQKRERLLLDAELVETLSDEAEEQTRRLDAARISLRACMQRLTETNRQLVELRYLRSMSLEDVAKAVDRTVGATKVALLRVRRQLAECMQRGMAEAG